MSTPKNISTQAGNSTAIALSIVAAGALIAVALYVALGGTRGGAIVQDSLEPLKIPAALRLVGDSDHVIGDPHAEISIIEYSDFECPFCGQLHPTIERIVEEHTDVNWAYRHFPLSSFHTRAYSSAHASECVAELGGNEAFWTFADVLFENQHSLGDELYESAATNLGIPLDSFKVCMNDDRYEQDINDDLREVQQVGGQGTPYVIVVNKDGFGLPFSGALPYETIENIIEALR